MSLVLALDQGTTSSRAVLFDSSGAIVDIAQQEFPQIYPRPGWVEHDPAQIWASQVGVAVEVLGRAGVGPRDVAAIGIAVQRETTVVWDRATGQPIHHAIVWQDRRTAERCHRLKAEGAEPMVRERTGLVIDPYFSATKIAWILEHVPGARRRAEAGELACGTVDSWLIWNLTGGRVHATDASNASRTLLFDIRAGRWHDDLLRMFDVPGEVLPQVRGSSEVYDVATAVPGLVGVPIAGVAGDQQAALFGQLALRPGLAKCTFGTGCFLLQYLGREAIPSRHRLLTTVAWGRGGKLEYAFEGSVFVGGAVVQWLRDGLGFITQSSDIEALAASTPDTGGVILVPAFAGLGAPHWDPHARGAIVGLTRGTTRAHIARAALESIGYQVADLVEAMRADAPDEAGELRVDGGAARNDLLMQFQADMLGVPVVRPQVTETTALGAAYLAGLAVGVWPSAAHLDEQWRVDRRFDPQMPANEREARRQRWHDAVDRSKGWA